MQLVSDKPKSSDKILMVLPLDDRLLCIEFPQTYQVCFIKAHCSCQNVYTFRNKKMEVRWINHCNINYDDSYSYYCLILFHTQWHNDILNISCL